MQNLGRLEERLNSIKRWRQTTLSYPKRVVGPMDKILKRVPTGPMDKYLTTREKSLFEDPIWELYITQALPVEHPMYPVIEVPELDLGMPPDLFPELKALLEAQ